MIQNPNEPRHPWSRLTAAARQVQDGRGTSAPYGFATRIAALAMAQERRVASLFEHFALKAVGVASLLALFSVALNYHALSFESAVTVALADEPELIAADDAVAAVLDFAD